MNDLLVYQREIESALEYAGGSHTFADVSAAVAEGRFQFWPAPSSVIITEIAVYPQYRAIHCFIAAGNLVELQAMQPIIEEWARSQGCTRASFHGRSGWARTFMARDGYKTKLVVFEKALDSG